jgi:hypothetical protein
MRILLDLFPAHLIAVPADFTDDIGSLKSYPPTPGSSYVGTTRVVITEEAIFVAIDSIDGPKIVFQEKYDEFLNDKEYRVLTISGKMVVFKKDTNCGCGSRLRGWNPYKTITSTKG